MQPGVVTGALLELHAARELGGLLSAGQWYDTTYNGNHGTLSTFAGTAASGYVGTGTASDPYRLVFDGASDYVALPDLGACEDKTFSVEAWVKAPATAAGQAILHEGASASTETFMLLQVRSNATSSFNFQMREAVGGGGAQMNVWTPNGSNDGGLHHLVGTADGVRARLYLDGAELASYSGMVYALPAGAFAVDYSTLGARRYLAGSRDSYMAGGIAGVRVYSRALSAAEVAQNYAAGTLWPAGPPTKTTSQATAIATPQRVVTQTEGMVYGTHD